MLFFYFWVLLTLAVVISVPTVHLVETSRRKKALAESEPDEPDEAADELGEEGAVEGEEPAEPMEDDFSAYGEGTQVGNDDFSAFEEEFK